MEGLLYRRRAGDTWLSRARGSGAVTACRPDRRGREQLWNLEGENCWDRPPDCRCDLWLWNKPVLGDPLGGRTNIPAPLAPGHPSPVGLSTGQT